MEQGSGIEKEIIPFLPSTDKATQLLRDQIYNLRHFIQEAMADL